MRFIQPMTIRAFQLFVAVACIACGCSKQVQKDAASSLVTNTAVSRSPVRPGTSSPASFTRLLEQRWPLESIRAFCIPERRWDAMNQRLVLQGQVWHGTLYTGQETGFDKISWAAIVSNGQIYEFDLDAEVGTNDWCLESGTVDSLKAPPAAKGFVGHK